MNASLPMAFKSSRIASWLPIESPSRLTCAVIRNRLWPFIASITCLIFFAPLLLQNIQNASNLLRLVEKFINPKIYLRRESQFYPVGYKAFYISLGAIKPLERQTVILRLTEDTEIYLRVPQVPRKLNARYGYEPEPRIFKFAVNDAAYLLPQCLLHPLGPLYTHRISVIFFT